MSLRAEIERVDRAEGRAGVVALVERRADEGDAEALLVLGQWRLWGAFGGQDLAEGQALIARAADLGNVEARLAAAALLATGTGVARDGDAAQAMIAATDSDIARAQIALLEAARAPSAAREVRSDPHVARIDGLWSPAECAHVMARAAPRLRPSAVIDPRTGQRIPNPIRTSDGCNFAPVDEDVVLNALCQRIADATGTAWEQGEPLQVLRYAPGQEYRPHLDALPGVANQRTLTVLVYLNDDFDGGATDLGDGLVVRGGVGDAIVFANLDAAGRPDPRTRHAGLPVTRGQKWLATRWIRQRRVHPWEPATLA